MNIISSACLLEILETFHATQLHRIPLINLAWVILCFCARVSVLCFTMKRESRYFERIYVQDYIAGSGKWVPRKILWDHKFSHLKIYLAQLKYNDIDCIRAINGRSISSIKMKKRPVYAKGNVRKDTKKHKLWKKRSKTSKNPIGKYYLAKLATSLQGCKTPYVDISWKIYTFKNSVLKRVLICDLFQKNQKGWVFHKRVL